MQLIIMIAVVTFAAALILTRRQSSDSQLIEPRASILTIGVQIICGNCSGDDHRPIKTYLERLGNCNQCGGRSYILASNRTVSEMYSNLEPHQMLQTSPDISGRSLTGAVN